jgi:hypothetical protein
VIRAPRGIVAPLLAGQMAPDYIGAVPTINLTADELAAVTAAIRGVIEDDKFPHAPRLDPLRAALARLDAADCRSEIKRAKYPFDRPQPSPAPEGPAASQSRQAGAITGRARQAVVAAAR